MSGFVVRGWGASFKSEDGKRALNLPYGHILVNDHYGRIFRRCDVFIVQQLAAVDVSQVDDASIRAAQIWFRELGVLPVPAELQGAAFDIPHDGWIESTRVSELRYHVRQRGRIRQGIHPYEHADGTPNPQLLFEHRSGRAWKIRLPDGCVIDERGFVKP